MKVPNRTPRYMVKAQVGNETIQHQMRVPKKAVLAKLKRVYPGKHITVISCQARKGRSWREYFAKPVH